MWWKRNSPIYDAAVFFPNYTSLSAFTVSLLLGTHFRLRENTGGSSVIFSMMPMPVFAAIVRLAIIAALIIGLRPGGVAIAWRMTIIGAVAVAVGATA